MIHVIMCDQYIAACTDTNAQLSEWIAKHPLPEHLRIERLLYDYPFVVFESNEDELKLAHKYHFFPGDYPEMNPEGFKCFKDMSPHHTIFRFTENWQGQPDWSDYMGLLDHEHSGEEEE